jgi:hypothetical protein
MAVSVAALSGGAYAAVLPGPIQHLAHRVLATSASPISSTPPPPRHWYQAGVATADREGLVSFTVRHLNRNISFRLAGPLTSEQVLVTVAPRLTVTLTPSLLPDTEDIVAYARYADPGDLAVLQIRVHGSWQDIAEQQLGTDDRTTFTVAAGEGQAYRILLLSTASPQVKPDIRTKRVLRSAHPGRTPG